MKRQTLFSPALLLIMALLLTVSALLSLPAQAQGPIPATVSYQGRVTIGGAVFSGTGYFKFAVMDSQGRSTWSNDGSSVNGSQPAQSVPLTVTGGLFNVLLGDTSLSGMTRALTPAVFADANVSLRVWFSADGTSFTRLIPDQRLAAVPFAFNASTLDSRQASDFAAVTHNHWGQIWSGAGSGLVISSTSAVGLLGISGGNLGILSPGVAGLATAPNNVTYGVYGRSDSTTAGAYGGYFTGYGGVYGKAVGYNGAGVRGESIDDAGGYFTSTNWIGVRVGHGRNGIQVDAATVRGIDILSAGETGVRVLSAGARGVDATGGSDEGDYGGYFTGYTGVYGYGTGNLGSGGHFSSDQGYGIHVQSTAQDGYGHAVYVYSASNDGVYVRSAGEDGFDVNMAGQDGLHVYQAGRDGLRVEYAASNGVVAETTNVNHEWGVNTSDKIRARNITMQSISMVARNDGPGALQVGDLVAVIGLARPAQGNFPAIPAVRSADARFTGVIGVVESRMELLVTDRSKAMTGPPPPNLTPQDLIWEEPRSVAGDAAPGQYVSLVVFGVADVKVDATEGAIEPGQRLTASSLAGHARILRSRLLDGMTVTEGAPVIGIALARLERGTGLLPVVVMLQ